MMDYKVRSAKCVSDKNFLKVINNMNRSYLSGLLTLILIVI